VICAVQALPRKTLIIFWLVSENPEERAVPTAPDTGNTNELTLSPTGGRCGCRAAAVSAFWDGPPHYLGHSRPAPLPPRRIDRFVLALTFNCESALFDWATST
jgi:hypothetical protein